MKNKNGIIKLLVTIFFTVSSFVFGTDMTPTSMGSCTSVTLIPGIEISFTGLGSHDNDNQSKSRTEQWEWNFDYDKNDPWSYDISTTSIDVEWVFSNDGPYNIAVKYYDNDGSDGNIYRFTVNIKSTRRTYYVKDHLGSIRMTIDENGEVVSAQDYHPYGEILRSINNSSVNEKYKFTEKERDTETDYDYFGARYLNSEIGRWNSVDPLADKYPGMSPYNSTLNNPLKYIDPNGMWVASIDSSGNIIVTYEEGDTYEDLYSQLGISAEDFSAQFGIDLSKGLSKTSFDITSNVLKNSKFSKDANGMNCFSSCLSGTGAMAEEMQIMGGFNFTESLQEGFGYEATQNPTTGTISTWKDKKGVTHHAAINIITSRNGTQYFYGRPGPGGSVGLQNSNSTGNLYPDFTKTYLIYTKTKPLF